MSIKPQPYRLAHGGDIKRNKPLRFTFDSKTYQGYEGDTLASALLANGVHLVGRSFKYHRPRGIMAAGSEEPNALIRLGRNNRAEPNLRATQIELFDALHSESQNRFPSLRMDMGAINSWFHRILPAGFYYKTFMWPKSAWRFYEHFIRRAAGLGKAPSKTPDPDRYEKTHQHCDILIVGGGIAGLMAAHVAGKSGARVILADEQNNFGGWMLAETDTSIDGAPAKDWIKNIIKRLSAMPNVTLLPRATVFAYMDHNFLTIAERVADHLNEPPPHLPRQRLWKVRAKQVILAQGCHERPVLFGGNDLPGVMLSGAVRSYINRYAVAPGRRAIVVTNNDDAYRTAFAMSDAGIHVAGIVDMRPSATTSIVAEATKREMPIYPCHAILEASGGLHVGQAKIARYDPASGEIQSNPCYIDCDLIAMSGGFTPIVNLHSQGRGKLAWDKNYQCFIPSEYHSNAIAIGACNGTFDLNSLLKEAQEVSADIVKRLKLKSSPTKAIKAVAPHVDMKPFHSGKIASDGVKTKAFVDFQNDVTADDINLAIREGYESVEHLKRYTTTGMATDQGKTSNINALGIMAEALDMPIPTIGTTTFRPPYTPTSIGAIAGRDIGNLFDPERRTRMDSWHEAAGAKFEHVGQWMRAWYYPQGNETMHEAVNREALAARSHAGILDASTLGKIDIQGKDAAEFLERIYTNSWANLKIGKCRYGLMLKDDGMVMDDGVTTRLAENHFHMTTTTGGAAPVLDWLEEWKQTEWNDLDVTFTSVTEQWSVATVSGPNARLILEKAGCSIALDNERFGFMSYKDAMLGDLPVRIFRISFTGELSFEINTPARHGLALWERLIKAGQDYGLTPYGTETMHVLRAEKGFIIVGQETDGSVNPHDLGMDWIIAKKKPDFVGKRALKRSGMRHEGRKQLVGLLTENPNEVIPEGAHAVLDPNEPFPMTMLGQVTSSYYSANLGHSIALALLKDGHAMKGKTVYFPMLDGKKPIKAKITAPIFYDKKGERLNG